MKVFFLTLITTFSLLMAGYYTFEYYQTSQRQQELPDDTAHKEPTQDKPVPDVFVMPEKINHIASDAVVVTSGRRVARHAVAQKALEARGYGFSGLEFFTAISRDDNEAVDLFLKAGMPIKSSRDYYYELSADNLYGFYASQATMLYNPLSLAIIAGAERSLPLLLAVAKNQDILWWLNDKTSEHRKGPDRSRYDLLGLAVQSGDLKLLRTLIAAGLKPISQSYLLVATYGTTKGLPAEASAEAGQQSLRNRADMLVELINNGQKVNQRIPIPIPIPCAMEMFFALAGKDIRQDVISRVADTHAAEELQAMADNIDRTIRPSKKDSGQKIAFDLTRLDANGLQGPPDGKVSISYEFSIPDNETSKNQVSQIDKTVQFMPGSRGRVGTLPGQCLCIGSTGQKDFREVLLKLAALPYIARIIVCDFE